MIEDYISFNAAKFVKDYYRFKSKIAYLERQLEDINYISAVQTEKEKVKNFPSGSPVEAAVLRRAAIQDKIAQYRRHIETYQNAEKLLLPEEKEVLDVFFQNENKIAAIIDLEERGYSRANAYKIRKAALDKIAEAIAGVEASK